MADILNGLNAAQRHAVTSTASVLQVLAPPGSGKTKTLTTRVAFLLAEKQLRPWNILVCTFTVKAAKEMRDRIRGFVGEGLAKQLLLGTFHSLALRYLKQYGQHIGLDKSFNIADSSDSLAIVKRIIDNNKYGIKPQVARSRISNEKARGTSSDEFTRLAKNIEQQEFAHIYRDYEATLKASNLLDYDDLLLRCRFLMTSYPQCVANIEAVLIDEFQDTNTIQYDLMRLFAQHRNFITIVGDPDQSIYGFRSAEIRNLTRMKQQWRDTQTINLEENYRSSGAILHAAQKLIEQDEARPPKRLQATHSIGLRPVLRKLPTAAGEATWLVSEVQRMCALTGGLLKPSDFAVLLRANSLSLPIETALGKAGVPYRMLCGTRFYDRIEVKILIDYLRVIDNSANSEAVERIVNVPARRLGDATVKSLTEEAKARGIGLWKLLLDIAQGRIKPNTKLAPLSQKGLECFVDVILSGQRKAVPAAPGHSVLLGLIDLVVRKLDYQQYIKNKYPEDHEVRWTNVEELMAQALDMSDSDRVQALMKENALPEVEGFDQQAMQGDADTLSLFLANVALTAKSEEKAENARETIQQLTLTTIHSAKGLEWPVVFIPACYEGSIPSSRSEDTDEERRLLYVGMTRAQVLLYLSCSQNNTRKEGTAMSSFLTQPGLGSYFEEHGPSINAGHVAGLATTLRRERPSAQAITSSHSSLERDEDNYWPLTGEMPLEEAAKWENGLAKSALHGFSKMRPASVLHTTTVTMQQSAGFSTASATLPTGFVSVSARYDELMEQSALRKVDKRVEENKQETEQKSKGRKKQMQSQGSITGFFAKKSETEQEDEVDPAVPPLKRRSSSPSNPIANKKPLHELHNLSMARANVAPNQTLSHHKPRAAPLSSRPTARAPLQAQAVDSGYVFLSSSPPQADDNENDAPSNKMGKVSSKPALTFHVTSVQMAAPQRRTLGMRRSLQGWSARGGKG